MVADFSALFPVEIISRMLGVPEGPVVTEDAARAMALGARRVLRTDVGIAVTGVAGPERQEDRPAGTVCLAVAIGEPGSAGEGDPAAGEGEGEGVAGEARPQAQ